MYTNNDVGLSAKYSALGGIALVVINKVHCTSEDLYTSEVHSSFPTLDAQNFIPTLVVEGYNGKNMNKKNNNSWSQQVSNTSDAATCEMW